MISLSECIKKFIIDCMFHKCLNEKTIRAYRCDLDQLNKKISNNSITSRDILYEYVEFLNKNYKPSSVKRKLACIKSFYSFLEFERIIERTPFTHIKIKIKEPLVLPRNLRLNEMQRILYHVYKIMNECNKNSSKYKV